MAWDDYTEPVDYKTVQSRMSAHVGHDGSQPAIDALREGEQVVVFRDLALYDSKYGDVMAVLFDTKDGPCFVEQTLKGTSNDGTPYDNRWVASRAVRMTVGGGARDYMAAGQEFGRPVALFVNIRKISKFSRNSGKYGYRIQWDPKGPAEMPPWFGGGRSSAQAAPAAYDDPPIDAYDDDPGF